MSSAIIKFEDEPNKMIYWKDHAYPSGLGFKLVDYYEDKCNDLYEDKSLFEIVTEIPHDIQYEYIVKTDHTIHCQECWYTADKSYHGGGFRHGGIYNLKEWQEKISRQKEYSFKSNSEYSVNKNIIFEIEYITEDIINFWDNDKEMKKSTDSHKIRTNKLEVLKKELFDYLDVPSYEVTRDNIRYFMMTSELDISEKCIDVIEKYMSFRKITYENINKDIDEFLSKDSGKNLFEKTYIVPYEYSYYYMSEEEKKEIDESYVKYNTYIKIRIER